MFVAICAVAWQDGVGKAVTSVCLLQGVVSCIFLYLVMGGQFSVEMQCNLGSALSHAVRVRRTMPCLARLMFVNGNILPLVLFIASCISLSLSLQSTVLAPCPESVYVIQVTPEYCAKLMMMCVVIKVLVSTMALVTTLDPILTLVAVLRSSTAQTVSRTSMSVPLLTPVSMEQHVL